MTDLSITVPDSCTLPTRERPTRIAEWAALFALVLRTEYRGRHHGRLFLPGEAELEHHVRDLATRESQCCTFYTFETGWETSETGDRLLTLDVTVSPGHSSVLDSFLAWARRVSAADPEALP